MKYAKGTTVKISNAVYTVVGKWRDAYVFAPEGDQDTEVLMYTDNEIQEGLEAGWLSIKEYYE